MKLSSRLFGTEAPLLMRPSPSLASALVVGCQPSQALATARSLCECNLHVTLATTFAEARSRLCARTPDVLVTDIRLDGENGIGLVVRGQTLSATLAAVVLADSEDASMRTDVESLAATFVVKPCDGSQLKAAVLRTLLRRPDESGAMPVIRPPFERRGPASVDTRASEIGERREIDLRIALAGHTARQFA